jgi:hypothetical protein
MVRHVIRKHKIIENIQNNEKDSNSINNNTGHQFNGNKELPSNHSYDINYVKPQSSEFSTCILGSLKSADFEFINEKNHSNSSSENLNEEDIFLKYFNHAKNVFSVELKKSDSSTINSILDSALEIIRDDSIIFLVDNINYLNYEEANLIYTIMKSLIFISNEKKLSDLNENIPNYINLPKRVHSLNLISPTLKNLDNFLDPSQNVLNYLLSHIDFFFPILINNLNYNNKDFVIIIIAKLLRKLCQIDSILFKIMTKDFFINLYSLTKNERFVLSQECFKFLFYLVENKNISQDYISQFLAENAIEICNVFNQSLMVSFKHSNKDQSPLDDHYFRKRESLILIEKFLNSSKYEKFNNFYLNYVENLKMVMTQLNNKCEKIVCQAIDILYFFFSDIEMKEKKIRLILHANKENFYKFFEANENLFKESNELWEKKSFILYELERLENYLD